MATPATRYVCQACGTPAPDLLAAPPLACPGATSGDDGDHVLGRLPLPAGIDFPDGDIGTASPFIRYRALLYPYQTARAGGMSDADYIALVARLDAAVGAVEGRPYGFSPTPLIYRSDLGVWVKEETQNVAGSHKARHLFGVLLQLEVLAALGRGPALTTRPLAIASCGNAALAAAVVARAAGRALRVFIPTDAHPRVVARLQSLGAHVEVCERQAGVGGDPSYHRFRAAVAQGALPFSCQGPDCGLTIDGGRTLVYELVDQWRQLRPAQGRAAALEHLVVQVGGGALGSACGQALDDAVSLGVLARAPHLHAVQTRGAFPLFKAHQQLLGDLDAAAGGPAAASPPSINEDMRIQRVAAQWDHARVQRVLREAAAQRRRYMQPWESTPQSVAHGILDDETYDWYALCKAILRSAGRVVVVEEATLIEANQAANQLRPADAVAVDETGSAGLAGVLAMRRSGQLPGNAVAAVIFSGARR